MQLCIKAWLKVRDREVRFLRGFGFSAACVVGRTLQNVGLPAACLRGGSGFLAGVGLGRHFEEQVPPLRIAAWPRVLPRSGFPPR